MAENLKTATTRFSLRIGSITLSEAYHNDGTSICLEQDDGEGGDFSVASLEAVLQKFYADNF